MNYKSVSIYVTPNNDLYILSNGVSTKWGGATIEIELHFFLENGYEDEALERKVMQAFDRWNTIKPNEELKPTAIEKIIKVKGYQKAVRQMRFLCVNWDLDDGYSIVPTENRGKNGFAHLEDETISLGSTPSEGVLATAIRTAISLSK